MKGEIFNFILHSDIGTSTTVANESFFIDWEARERENEFDISDHEKHYK